MKPSLTINFVVKSTCSSTHEVLRCPDHFMNDDWIGTELSGLESHASPLIPCSSFSGNSWSPCFLSGLRRASIFLKARIVPDNWKMDISEILESSSSDDEEDCPAEENEEEKEKEAKKEEEEPVGPIPDNMETLFVCFCFLVKVISPCVCSRLRVYIYIV